jgi:recombination protein RecA
LQGTSTLLPARSVLGLGWPELERVLPDQGLPCGVIEIAAVPPRAMAMKSRASPCPESMRGGGTSIAIAAMAAVHAKDAAAWCAWIAPHPVSSDDDLPMLYAPALVTSNVDLERMLVVRPSPQALARTAVKVAASGAFALVVVDVPHHQDFSVARVHLPGRGRGEAPSRHERAALVIRKLALAAEESGTTSLLLTSALAPRSVPWPVALRLEVERRPEALAVRITKDRARNRFGGGSSQHVVRLG